MMKSIYSKAVFLAVWLLALSFSATTMAGFMPSQARILSDMVLANGHFTNEWPVPGCSVACPGRTRPEHHLDPGNLYRG